MFLDMALPKSGNIHSLRTSLAFWAPMSLLAVLFRLLGQLRKEGPNVGTGMDSKVESSGKVDDNFEIGDDGYLG